MYKYKIEAYDDTDIGKLNVIGLVVTAKNEEEAMKAAYEMAVRKCYSVIEIEELSRDIKKG